MIMKNKDFKTLSQNEMKKVLGGSAVDCMAKITCGNGKDYTCVGNQGIANDGSVLNCSGKDNESASCWYRNDSNGWSLATIKCNNDKDATLNWDSSFPKEL